MAKISCYKLRLLIIRFILYSFCIRYSSKEAFAADARLVFDNCAYYNEDESEVIVCMY